jgi:hypothetical protein
MIARMSTAKRTCHYGWRGSKCIHNCNRFTYIHFYTQNMDEDISFRLLIKVSPVSEWRYCQLVSKYSEVQNLDLCIVKDFPG